MTKEKLLELINAYGDACEEFGDTGASVENIRVCVSAMREIDKALDEVFKNDCECGSKDS